MTEKKEMTSKELQQLLEQDKTKREQTCRSEIEMILQKYNCQLIAFPQYAQDGRTVATIQIRASSDGV